MNIKRIFHVFKGEMRCVLRDRTTLIMMVVLPIITYPMVAMVVSWMMLRSVERIEHTPVTAHVINAPAEFLDRLQKISLLKISTHEVDLEELRAGRIDLRVEFAATFESGIQNSEMTTIHVRYDNTEFRSRQAQKRVADVMLDWRRSLVDAGLERRNLPRTIIKPFWIDTENIAPPRKVGGFLLGQMVPILLIIFAAIGAFYPAIDVTAMEKERGTLESLLVAPIPAAELMLGKFLSVFSLTLFSVFLNVGSIALTASHGMYFMKQLMSRAGDVPDFTLSISPAMFITILLTMIPVVVIVSSLMMIVAMFARGFKEAQNYMTPLLIFFTAPPMITVFPGFELNHATAMIPLANIALLFRDMLLGKFALGPFLITMITTTLLAAGALRIAIAVFKKEEVLFRSSEDLSTLLPTAESCRRSSTRIPLAWILFTTCVLLVYYAGFLLQARDVVSGLAVTEIVLILIPALIYHRFLRMDTFTFPGFSLPGLRNTARLLAITATGGWMASTIAQWVFWFAPPPEGAMEAISQTLQAETMGGILPLLITVAVLPAICEEFLFRGTILPVFRSGYSDRAALILTAILFGVIHLDPWRFFPTAFLGLILGIVQLRCRTMLAPSLIHLLNNAAAVMLLQFLNGVSVKESPLFFMTAVSLLLIPVLLRALNGLNSPAASVSDSH